MHSSLHMPMSPALPFEMPSIDRHIVTGDQFSFSSTSSRGEVVDEYGLAFGEWTGWHPDNYHTSGHYNEPQWLMKASSQASDEHACPASQEQAIARHKEMLEMAKDAPEYACELSLTDLAELPRMVRAARESPAREGMQKKRPRSGGKVTISGRYSTSGSMETGGFLLKMLFPMPSPSIRRSGKGSSNRLKSSRRLSSGGRSSGADSGCSDPPKHWTKDGKKAVADGSSDEQQAPWRLLSILHQPKEKQEQVDLTLRRFLRQNIKWCYLDDAQEQIQIL